MSNSFENDLIHRRKADAIANDHLLSLKLLRGVEPDGHAQLPDISIVVAAYSHGNYIEQCLQSINSSAVTSMELLVIDDGSPDDTLRKTLDFPFRSDLRVRVYTKPNQGLPHSLRCGLDLAQGKYIAFMASDDCYIAGGIESALDFLVKARPPIDTLLCQATTIGLTEDLVYKPDLQRLFEATPFDRLESIWSAPPSPMLLQATVFKTQFLRGLRPWANALELDDWATFIQVFVAETYFSARICYEPTLLLSKYRIHAGGIHAQLDRHLRVVEQVVAALVPPRYRGSCLAQIRINMGMAMAADGRWAKGLKILLRGIIASPSLSIVRLLTFRIWRFTVRRLRSGPVKLDSRISEILL